jgi:NADPH-dependent 2,4-dienoyl-CoA reductase/sulfur reductase-like enzyme
VALREGARREAGADVAVTVIGAEARLPYNRTTVNKGLLSGAVDDAAVALPGMQPTEGARGPHVQWRTGSVAEALDLHDRVVRLHDGSVVHFDAVVVATGAVPRPLPAPVEPAARNRVLTLRAADDTHRLRALISTAGSDSPVVVVTGAGLLGTEVAAVLQALGCRVTVVDRNRSPLARRLGSTVAAWIRAAHGAAGVDLRLGVGVSGVRVRGAGLLVDLDDGQTLQAAAAVACLGVEPATDWLAGSGLATRADGGIVVGSDQRVAGFRGVYAAGDLAAVPGPDGSPVRVEHWGAALEQGQAAAASVLADLGVAMPPDTGTQSRGAPSCSTYVHGTKVTILGWPGGVAAERPVSGSPGDPRFAVALLDPADRVVGAVGVGGARAVNALRPLIERRGAASELEPVEAIRAGR